MPIKTAEERDEAAAHRVLGRALMKVLSHHLEKPFIDLSDKEMHQHIAHKLINALHEVLDEKAPGGFTARCKLYDAELWIEQDPTIEMPRDKLAESDDDIPF